MKDLKTVYKANNEETALIQLDFFEDKWGSKYPSCVSSWRNNWAELSVFFKYPPEIRKLDVYKRQKDILPKITPKIIPITAIQ